MYEFPLTGAQKSYLRGAGQTIDPGLKVGRGGLTPEFFADCKRALRDGGVFVTQNGLPFLFPGHLEQTTAALANLFKRAAPFLCAQPCYFGGPFALNWGSDDVDLLDLPVKKLARRQHKRGIETRYWTPAVHAAAFALPGYVQAAVDKALAVPAKKKRRLKSKMAASS